MAMAATWAMSTARSPTTWQPKILTGLAVGDQFAKTHLRPSMIVRVVESKCTTAVTTSCVSRAFASVRPTCAYSGSVKLPIGLTWSPSGSRRALHGVGGRDEAVLDRLRDEHQAAGDVPRREDMRRGRPQIFIDLHEPRDDRSRRPPLRGSSPAVSATQPTATTASVASALSRWPSFEKIIRTPARRLLEGLDGAEVLMHRHARLAECRRNRRRHVFVFGRQNARAGLEELDFASRTH